MFDYIKISYYSFIDYFCDDFHKDISIFNLSYFNIIRKFVFNFKKKHYIKIDNQALKPENIKLVDNYYVKNASSLHFNFKYYLFDLSFWSYINFLSKRNRCSYLKLNDYKLKTYKNIWYGFNYWKKSINIFFVFSLSLFNNYFFDNTYFQNSGFNNIYKDLSNNFYSFTQKNEFYLNKTFLSDFQSNLLYFFKISDMYFIYYINISFYKPFYNQNVYFLSSLNFLV